MAHVYTMTAFLLFFTFGILNVNGKIVNSRTTVMSGSTTVTKPNGQTVTTLHTAGGTYVFISLPRRSDGSLKAVPLALIVIMMIILIVCVAYRLYLMYYWCNAVGPELPFVQNTSTTVYVIPDNPLAMPPGHPSTYNQPKVLRPPEVTPWPIQQYVPASSSFTAAPPNLQRSASDTCLPMTPCPNYDELYPKVNSASGARRYSAHLVGTEMIPTPKTAGQRSAEDPMNKLQPGYLDEMAVPEYSPLNREEFFAVKPNMPNYNS